MRTRHHEATAAKILFLDIGISSANIICASGNGFSMVEKLDTCCPGWNAKFEQRKAQATFIKQEQDADTIHTIGNDGTLADIERQCGVPHSKLTPSSYPKWDCSGISHVEPGPGVVGYVSERDSAEADAAQGLILNHGASPAVLMRAAKNGCVFARAEVQTLQSGRQILAIPKGGAISLTSPLAIQMLMHFYANRDRFISAPVSCWPPAQREIVEGFKAKGLIFERDHEDFGTTDKGSLIVATLKAVMSESLRKC